MKRSRKYDLSGESGLARSNVKALTDHERAKMLKRWARIEARAREWDRPRQ